MSILFYKERKREWLICVAVPFCMKRGIGKCYLIEETGLQIRNIRGCAQAGSMVWIRSIIWVKRSAWIWFRRSWWSIIRIIWKNLRMSCRRLGLCRRWRRTGRCWRMSSSLPDSHILLRKLASGSNMRPHMLASCIL